MRRHLAITWSSSTQGGVGMRWGDLMKMSIEDRDIIEEALLEMREKDFETIKRLHGHS